MNKMQYQKKIVYFFSIFVQYYFLKWSNIGLYSLQCFYYDHLYHHKFTINKCNPIKIKIIL